jgi:hypothetical protein
LDRAGRRREALAKLSLATIPDEWFAEAKRVSDELWLNELRAFRCEVKFDAGHPVVVEAVVDREATVLAWRTKTAFGIGNLRTGISLVKETRMARVFVRRGRVLVRMMDETLVELSGADGREVIRAAPGWPSDNPWAVSPSGDHVAVSYPGEAAIHAWPSLERVREIEHPYGWFVAWGLFELRGFAEESRSGPLPEIGQYPELLSERLVNAGRRLFDVGTGELVVELEGQPDDLSLSSDERGLRFTRDDDLVRVELTVRGGRAARGRHSWHPHADAIAWIGKLSFVGGSSIELGEVQPLQWADDGHALLVKRERPGRDPLLELWRAP